MSLTATFVVLGVLLFQNSSASKKSDRELDGFVGNVRSVLLEIAVLSVENGRPTEGKRFGQTVTRYDDNGNKTEVVQLFGGLIGRRVMYERLNDATYVRKTFDAEKSNAGRATSVQSQPKPVPLMSRCTIEYDDAGNRTEEVCYDQAGKLQDRSQYRYDSKGNRTTELNLDKDGKVVSSCSVTRDDRGHPIEHSCSYSDGISSFVKQTFSYEFDSSGNWIKRFGSAWQMENGKMTPINKDIVYRTISYDPSKDVYPDDRTKLVDSLPAGPMVIRKSGGVFQESATKRVKPSYPNEALVAGVTGDVVVEVKVDEQGKVESAEAISGPAELRAVAVDAAKKWEFKPTLLSGTAVKVIGRLTFNFRR